MSGQTDKKVYHDLLSNTGVKLILVNFRKFSVEDTSSYIPGDKDVEEQKDVDRGCEEISDYVVHVDPGRLQEAPRRLANCIMTAMTNYLESRIETDGGPIERVAVSAQTFEYLDAHSSEVYRHGKRND